MLQKGARPNKCYTSFQLRLHSRCQGEKHLRWEAEKCSHAVHERGFSIQFPSLIALLLIQSVPCARCGPDTTYLRVWELSVNVIQESLLKPVRVKCTASHFPSNKEDDRREERNALQGPNWREKPYLGWNGFHFHLSYELNRHFVDAFRR